MFVEKSLSFKNPFWMYLLGSLIVIIFNLIGQIPLYYFIMKDAPVLSQGDNPMELLRNLDKNLQLFLLLIPFVISLLGFWLVIRKLHERSLLSVTTDRKKMDWQRVLYAFCAWGTIILLLTVADYFMFPEDYSWNFQWKPFLILLIIGTLLIPLQTSMEEYIFRGYLMQGFGRLFRNRWAPLVFTSVIFGSLHIFNPEIEKLGYALLFYYIGTGFFLGIMTLMDEGIELALGFHAANNLIMSLLVTSDWTAFQTESLLIDVSEPSLGSEMILMTFVIQPLFLLLLSKKYQWKNWKNKLTAKF